jgi:Na+-translocating ferredoxin:NAD+ oxidoreductase subunit B
MIIEAVIGFGILSLLFALLIAYFSKRFNTNDNPKLEEVAEALPGRNCTACGFPNCSLLAEAIIDGKAKANACILGGNDTAKKVSKILGQDVEEQEVKVAKIFCKGGRQNDDTRSDYSGIKTCEAARIVSHGLKQCLFGCLMFYDCIKICPVRAIEVDANSLPWINKNKCVGCGLCVKICPLLLIELVPKKSEVHVLCSSQDTTKDTIKNCKVGCIACRQCEKVCKYDAIHVANNHAHVNYTKCTNCKACVAVCPRKIIINESIA